MCVRKKLGDEYFRADVAIAPCFVETGGAIIYRTTTQNSRHNHKMWQNVFFLGLYVTREREVMRYG